MNKRTVPAAALLLPLAVAACAPSVAVFTPAPSAQPAPATGGAVATNAGVRVVAQGNAWTGQPTDLDQDVTPFLVRVANNGRQPLLLRYRSFRLVTPAGVTYYALPPFNIRGTVTETVTPAYGYSGFAVAPYLSPFYPGLGVASPFWGDDPYYGAFWPLLVQINLPTGDMVRKALPEGVLSPGGVVSGFLYFQKVSPKAQRARFTMNLLNANTHKEFGQVNIPFVVK